MSDNTPAWLNRAIRVLRDGPLDEYTDEEVITPWVHPCPACGGVNTVSFYLGDYWCRCGHEWTD